MATLSAAEACAMLALRQAVFIIEQRCIYADIDAADRTAYHLLGWQKSQAGPEISTRVLAAYLRVLPPGTKSPECVIGRVVTAPHVRGTGLGRLLMHEGLQQASRLYPGLPIKISAQVHLQRFYKNFGFVAVSVPYDEDGIAHIDMLRRGF